MIQCKPQRNYLATLKTYFSYYLSGILLFSTIFASCHEPSANNEVTEAKVFPKNLVNAKDSANYFTLHFFDSFAFETNKFPNETALQEYIASFQKADTGVVKQSLQNLLQKSITDSTSIDQILGGFEKYLYNPNSQLRNDYYFDFILQYLLENKILTSTLHKQKAEAQHAVIGRNNFGQQAQDFSYITINGKRNMLYNTQSDYILLFFYDAECNSCENARLEMIQSELLQRLIAKRTLTILALYPLKNEKGWNDYAANIPTTWINGYNKEHTIKDNNLFDVRAFPTFYLLDKNKKVILKDATLKVVMNKLNLI